MSAKRVVVTGASSGIGRELSLLCASRGHRLVLSARREVLLREVAEECHRLGSPQVEVEAFDIGHVGEAARLRSAVQSLGLGRVVLVNNAGFGLFGPYHETPWETVAAHVQVLLLGAMAATRELLPLMLDARDGHIVNVLSITTQVALPGSAAYSAAKGGLYAFGKALSAEVRRKGVRVSHVHPGATNTPIWEAVGQSPPREDMIPARAVAEAILGVIETDDRAVVDDLVLTPPQGLL
ncbi:MAG: SDR family NAD(P)-dependent oxidoreductase [Fimbriimonadaceae bacterium]|nr:SDR family NAD(P)-dependent oxidoreductase [Fimbriimonadaceae bacterium]QYK59697.1 MAG: SDR family NAD(P)-dependent oxidoreductase [Fimbriimonadaceae bacterium]